VTGRLDGRVAIVTGAGRGIGRGVAIELAKEGARVAVVSRTGPPVERVVEEVRAGGGEAIGVRCDVGDERQVQAAVDETVAAFGAVDVLVNVAQGFSLDPAVGYRAYPLDSYPEEVWDHFFQTGVKGTLYAMKAVFPHMRDRGGKIVNFGSEVGQHGAAGAAAYAANKEAIRALSRCAAREWGPHGITVNVINPVIETEASSWTRDPRRRAEVEASTALGRVAKPAECGRVVAFLASADADYLTGMTVMVDGGRYLFA
jgi:NAD(P)-dependent dehydrogenase (short-subunit alcohol dehydrogenase family)